MTGQSAYRGPYRGRFGSPRGPELAGLALPPAAMPSHRHGRPLKAWRYVGVYGPEVMVCLAAIRIGPVRQCFWSVWDRTSARLHERTALGRGRVRLGQGVASVDDGPVVIDLRLDESAGIETVCPHEAGYAWTRKQGGVPARGSVQLDGARIPIDGRAVIDDTAAYYARHTHWQWCAGVGQDDHGRALAWNLVSGVNDPPEHSERTMWVDGEAHEAPPCRFSTDLSRVDKLHFAAEAVRERRENLLLVRSDYRQPFGTFSGQLPGGIAVREGYGVMEQHDVWW